MSTRRSFIASSFTVLGATALAPGIEHASAATSGALPLEVMGNPYNSETYRQLVAACGQPCTLSLSPRESDETVRSLLLRAFTQRRLPDVAFMNGDVIRVFAERGLLTSLDAMLVPGMQAQRIGGVAYGVSFGLSLPVVAINARHMRESGVDTLPPDWPGVLALARRMNSAGMTGGFIEHDNGGAFTFLYLLESHGGRLMSADERELAFDSPAGLEALRVLQSFGECGQATADMSRRQARRAFAAGKIGVLVTMSSVIPSLRKSVDLQVMPLPLMNDAARVPAAGPAAVMMTRDRTQEAWELMRFATRPEAQAILERTSGYVPLAEAPDRVTPWYTVPGRNSLKISELIQNEMQQVATLQKTPAAAMASMRRSVPRLLARH